MHLTQHDYEWYLIAKPHSVHHNETYGGLSLSQYRLFSDALQAELHKKYDLSPRPVGLKNNDHPPPRKFPAIHSKKT